MTLFITGANIGFQPGGGGVQVQESMIEHLNGKIEKGANISIGIKHKRGKKEKREKRYKKIGGMKREKGKMKEISLQFKAQYTIIKSLEMNIILYSIAQGQNPAHSL